MNKDDIFKIIEEESSSETLKTEILFTKKEIVRKLKELTIDSEIKIGFNNIATYVFRKHKIKINSENKIYVICINETKIKEIDSWLINSNKSSSYTKIVDDFIDHIFDMDYVLDEYHMIADGMGYGMKLDSWEIPDTDGLRHSEYVIDNEQYVILKVGFIDFQDCYVECKNK